MEKRLLLLIPTTTYRASDFLKAAERLGVEVVVGSEERPALEGLSKERSLTLDFNDLGRSAREIAAYARENPLDAIVAVDGPGALLAARAAQRLELPHNFPEAVEAAQNKHLFRQGLARAGLPGPVFELFSTGDDPASAARRAPGYPCVLKPLTLSASQGVIRADTPEEFAAAFGRIEKILHDPELPISTRDRRRILAETYLPGDEVALEGLLTEGRLTVLALFDKPDPMEGPFFEETIYLTPSRLPKKIQQGLAQMTQRAVRALGLTHGPIHAELRINQDGLWPIEIAPRSIGGLCSRVLRFAMGLSLEELILSHATGHLLESLPEKARPAGVMMIPIPRSGVLKKVDGLLAASRVEGIEEVEITIARGEQVTALPEGHRYLGFLFARGESAEEVERALRQAHENLEFEIT